MARRSPEPSEEKPVNEEPSSEEEESEDDEESESHSSEEEKEKYTNGFSGETGQDEDKDLKLSKSKIDSKSVNQGSNFESDLGSPSGYKLQPVPRVSKSTSKRTHDDGSQRPVINSKRSKSGKGKSVGSSSGCINKLWGDKDEITVLNGLIELNNNTGALYNFIKGKLEVDFSKDQLNSKVRRMRNKFLNERKKNENGEDEDPVFSTPHEYEVFELSKKIWGGCVGIEKVESDGKKIVNNENDGDDFGMTQYPFLSHSFENLSSVMPSLDMSKTGMSFALSRLSSTSKAKELDEKWKLLIKEEFELNHKKLTLMKEQMNMALDFDE